MNRLRSYRWIEGINQNELGQVLAHLIPAWSQRSSQVAGQRPATFPSSGMPTAGWSLQT